MPVMKRWSVDILIDENDGHTYAEARLHSGADQQLVGIGRARLNPADDDIPEIGDELAAARALTDLGHRLLVAAATDITALTVESVHATQWTASRRVPITQDGTTMVPVERVTVWGASDGGPDSGTRPADQHGRS